MEKTVLVELTSKKIKLAEGIVLFALFVSLLAGFGLLYIAVPLGNTDVVSLRSVLSSSHRSPYSRLVVSRISFDYFVIHRLLYLLADSTVYHPPGLAIQKASCAS